MKRLGILFLLTACSTISPSRRILKSGEMAVDLNVSRQFYGDSSKFVTRATSMLGKANAKWVDLLMNPGVGASVGVFDLFHVGLHIYSGTLLAFKNLAVRPSIAVNALSFLNFEFNAHYAPTIFVATNVQSKSAMMSVFGLTAALNLVVFRPYIVGELGWAPAGGRFWNGRGGASLNLLGWELVGEVGIDNIGYKPNADGTGNIYVLNVGLGYSF